jgi:hypothetical protein
VTDRDGMYVHVTAKGLREPETVRHFCLVGPPSPAAETGSAGSNRANGAEIRGSCQRPQETGFAPECVVGLAGLEPAPKRL